MSRDIVAYVFFFVKTELIFRTPNMSGCIDIAGWNQLDPDCALLDGYVHDYTIRFLSFDFSIVEFQG